MILVHGIGVSEVRVQQHRRFLRKYFYVYESIETGGVIFPMGYSIA